MTDYKLNSRLGCVYWEEQKIIYMHNNKAATNSINRSLRQTLTRPDGKTNDFENRDDWLIFTFVREPWERVISCFTHNILQGKITGPLKSRGFVPGMTLPAFIKKVCDTSDLEADKHFVSQCYRLSDDEGRFIPNWIGIMERKKVVEDWDRLKREFKRRGIAPLKRLPWMKRRRKFRTLIPAKQLYSKKLQGMVRERFFEDYHRFDFGEKK